MAHRITPPNKHAAFGYGDYIANDSLGWWWYCHRCGTQSKVGFRFASETGALSNFTYHRNVHCVAP